MKERWSVQGEESEAESERRRENEGRVLPIDASTPTLLLAQADDDIWVNLTSTAAMLQHSLRSISLDQQAGPLGARL